MSQPSILVGKTPLQTGHAAVEGEFVTYQQREYYKLANYDQMRPFFISLVSDADHWLFLSSKGGLTAGRKNPDHALFPYYTDDKIHDGSDQTGPKTVCLVEKDGQQYYWEPFSEGFKGAYRLERNLYKSLICNEIFFEEINHDLALTFTYGWSFSNIYGMVRWGKITQHGEREVAVRLVDGLQNLLPYGVNLMMQTERSTLLDAYKKNELLDASGLGLFLLSSVPVDKAEPSEALRATTVWQSGLDAKLHLLSDLQLPKLRQNAALTPEVDVRAERGAYLVESQFQLAPEASKGWFFVAEINQGPAEVVALDQWLQKNTHEELTQLVFADIAAGSERLRKIVAMADGLQLSADRSGNTRHFANVLFNVMRGGIFNDQYNLPKADLLPFLQNANAAVAEQQSNFLAGLPPVLNYVELQALAQQNGDPDLIRLCQEYLPLIFSRRHGDPSRPWNRFSIELVDELGYAKFYYQGNWRDIFQNWEALAMSYPHFLESIIAKFVNASTADGYNPYRITRDGIDWEVIEPDDPWSYIGYWGDHQIIYLLKLLELLQTYQPGALQKMLLNEVYVYADVPYRIRPYAALLENPQDTIDFDHTAHARTEERVARLGSDGKLVQDEKGLIRVNLLEKLLLTLATKLSNYIPEAGIWLNTQRPEWNDANNALVGYGVSMVTLYHIRRYVCFLQPLLDQMKADQLPVSTELARLLRSLRTTFTTYKKGLDQARTPQLRRQLLDELGQAGEAYRTAIYAGFSRQQQDINRSDLRQFLADVLACIDHTIAANEREDGLYHSYNLLKINTDGGISIRYLYEMLEGQVAVLSSGYLSPQASIPVLQAMRKSRLYRADQHSYLLYPDRQLPRFEVKNTIPKEGVERSALLQEMLTKADHRIIVPNATGGYHFNGDFHNANDVQRALEELPKHAYQQLNADAKQQVLDLFEQVFDHQSFTGRSGTFFGYEGLGCIYWHMVSKLILAAAENCRSATEQGEDETIIDQLIAHYYDLQAGLGTHKTPENYGAFPSDPYSHTPGNAGAQQPGMTGQVKEDIISRFTELGLWMTDGKLHFRPRMLRQAEFLTRPATFNYFALDGDEKHLSIPADALVFTLYQVPFVYQRSEQNELRIHLQDGQVRTQAELVLEGDTLAALFAREGSVVKVEVLFGNEQMKFAE
ncbi:MAG: hypothetical protein AAGJ82_03810 [Bacteroidota bacterium]